MLVRAEAFLRTLRRVFSRDEWMARLLSLSIARDKAVKPGLVMIQIDGLGFTQFERALQKGKLPFLAKLLKDGSYLNKRHYTGLPSNTPAVQGALFYGVESCVPAFGFKDSRSGEVFMMFSPQSASAVESRLKEKGGRPLLAGGSSYGNIFTGGAAEAHFCVSSTGWGSLIKAANPFGAPLTILLNAPVFIRALFLMAIELLLAIADFFRSVISGKRLASEVRFIPLRVAICVLLREAIATGARIDIARGLPVIHANFGGYDEEAHHRGPGSAFAHWSLGAIDSAIQGIWHAAQRSKQRDYDVFIYSDHGQEETEGYDEVCGRSISQAVNRVFEEKIISAKWCLETSRHIPYWRAGLLRNKPRQKAVPAALALEAKEGMAPLPVIVSAIGPVGHIYPPLPLSFQEKEKFAEGLVASAQIPIVMTKSKDGKVFAWNSKGKFTLPEEADKVIASSHPFFDEAARDLVGLCHHPDAGEFIILGWQDGPRTMTFQGGELGSHAGPGPEETSGFALLPVDALLSSHGQTIRTKELRQAAFRCLERHDDKDFSRCHKADPSSVILRVMTYNVHACMGRDGKVSPHRIARIIARHHPDVVALQELDTRDHVRQAEVIAQKLAMAFHFHPGFEVKKEGRGNAILSRFPMRPIRTGHLPRLSQSPLFEPRGALWVEIDLCGHKAQVFNTHLSLFSKEGLLQTEALLGEDWMGNPACQGPVIFCGDFNASAASKVLKRLSQKLKNAQSELSQSPLLKTLPSFFPVSSVDHVFVGPGIRVLKTEAPRTALEKVSSDHLPLIVEVQLTQD